MQRLARRKTTNQLALRSTKADVGWLKKSAGDGFLL